MFSAGRKPDAALHFFVALIIIILYYIYMIWNESKNRIEGTDEAGRVLAFVDFPGEETVTVTRTFADESLRGQGIAGRMMQMLHDKLEREGRKAVLLCSYAVKWYESHPECGDVLERR